MGRLTEEQLLEWIEEGRPVAGRSDGAGLTFTLSAAGTAAWVLRYSLGGERKELTLGRYPEMSLAKARDRVDVEHQQIASGCDVAAEKAAARRVSRLGALGRKLSTCESELESISNRLAAVRLELQKEIAKWES
jgi:hypothetical protein